jgi:PAS domain S-box-containing protein
MDKRLQQLIEHAADAILVVDRQGLIRYWNIGAEQMFGYSAGEAVGQSLDLIIPEKLRSRHWEGFFRVMDTGQTKYISDLLASPGVRKDGARLSLEFSIVLLRNEDGEIEGCASIMRDMTSRWQREKALKERLAACESRRPGSAA